MGKFIVAAARFLLLCAVLLLFLAIMLPDRAFAQQPTPAMNPTQSPPGTLIPRDPEQRQIRYVAIPLQRFMQHYNPSAEEVNDYYTRHPEAFQRPEQEIKDKIREEKARDAAMAFVDDFLSALEANPRQFAELAHQHELNLVTTPFIPATGQVEGLASLPDLVKRVFALPELGADTLQGQDGTQYVFQTAAISQIMILDELNAFATKKAKAYKVTINSMDPNQGLEYKKFLRSPEDYLGQIVLMRGEMVGTGGTPAETLFKYVFVSSKPEQKSFHLLGLTPQSSVHKLRADDFLLIGAVTPGVPSMTGWGTKAGIDIYMICGILSDPPSKRAEVRCASGK